MLSVKSIKLTDFGRHKHVDAKLNGHVVGLTGSNGLGKSTVLQALQFAFTGGVETSPDRPMLSFIRRCSQDPPKFAEVDVEFVANGKAGRIVRRITRTTISRKLYWDGAEKPITSEKEVAKVLTEILGVDKRAINSTVFIRQGEMAAMFGGDKDRRDFYTRLLMLGHLAQVAAVIETHREHLASTVQDLGAVRDAADAAYEEARVFFDAADSALNGRPSRAEDLQLARRVVNLFSESQRATENKVKAVAQLAQLGQGRVLDAVSEVGIRSWIAELESEVESAEKERESLATQKSSYMTATADVTAAVNTRDRLISTRQMFQDCEAVIAEMETYRNLGEDPRPAIDAAAEKLRKMARRVELEASVTSDRPRLVKLTSDHEIFSQMARAKTETRDAARETYAALHSKLEMRQELRRSLEKGGDIGDECPLCYSAHPPDDQRLRADIEADTKRLDELAARGAELSKEVKEATQSTAAVAAELSALQASLQRDEVELKRLRIELSLVAQHEIEKDLESLNAQLSKYLTGANERDRLTRELSAKRKLVEGLSCPMPLDIDFADRELLRLQQEALAAPWSSAEEQRERQAVERARNGRAMLTSLQEHTTNLRHADKRHDDASADLAEVLKSAPKGFYDDVITGANSLTHAEALEKVRRLEQLTQEHDEARGRRDAAHDGLKAASRKIDELALRTAEQRHRLDLVKDLEILRDTFKPNGASLEYLNHVFGSIAEIAADYLAESGADFMVAASEEIPLAYEFLRTDQENEVWLPQDLLSGGQKVRLAVATLRAIHAMIMPDVGLLSLDEPTTHLDEEAKRSMADMLHQIGEEGTLQMVVCDHSPTLVDAFSDVIELN